MLCGFDDDLTAQLTEQRADIEAEILTVVDAHPSNLRPDLYARHRGQDSRAYPHRSRRQKASHPPHT